MAIKEHRRYIGSTGTHLKMLNKEQYEYAMRYLQDMEINGRLEKDFGGRTVGFFGGHSTLKFENGDPTYYLVIRLSDGSYEVLYEREYSTHSIADMYLKFREINKRFDKLLDEVKVIIEEHES